MGLQKGSGRHSQRSSIDTGACTQGRWSQAGTSLFIVVRTGAGRSAPTGTPPAIVQRIREDMNRIQATPELKGLMVRMSTEPPPIWTSGQFRSTIARDSEEWRKIAHASNIAVD